MERWYDGNMCSYKDNRLSALRLMTLNRRQGLISSFGRLIKPFNRMHILLLQFLIVISIAVGCAFITYVTFRLSRRRRPVKSAHTTTPSWLQLVTPQTYTPPMSTQLARDVINAVAARAALYLDGREESSILPPAANKGRFDEGIIINSRRLYQFTLTALRIEGMKGLRCVSCCICDRYCILS